jgi:hypothetical protein
MPVFNDFSDAVYEAIRSHFEINWANATPVSWPNEDFEEPPLGPWVKFEIFGSSYGQQSIGMQQQADNRWDRDGTIFFHVMVRRGSGESQARGAAKYIADLFRGRRLLPDESLEFMDAGESMGDSQGNWYRITVDIEWRHMDA